ncbi:hypothetical protein CTheo_1276 [Ceratobasidium theobromae]|uniref:Uncharacterized protein n=1 Tax=Ceratobasidium theobromae TaxID=1582974 RepID=A0A5N5QU61_9AGAM|nr:hypothetical protein CTheo_1276 [Ceratobasidium theobromae]
MSQHSDVSVTLTENSIQEDSGESEISNSLDSSQYTSIGSSASSENKDTINFSQALYDYTPPTVPESLGRTPPPMATPPNMSFSNHLAYIDAKLLEIAAARQRANSSDIDLVLSDPAVHRQGSKRAAPADFFIPIALGSQLPHTGPRRTWSKVARERDGQTPPEEQPGAKRRKLRQQDSTASAHTFDATEPASLRRAKSLVAGSVEQVRQLPAAVNPFQVKLLPITVPTIWPADAALARLRCLLEREANQRAEDAHLKSMSQQSSSVKFDFEMHFGATNWLFAVQGPPGPTFKSIRRHLRSSLETRFHAVLLFSRYAARLSSSSLNPFLKPRREYEGDYRHRVRERLVNEVALGSLQFHRDFLPPLLPMMAEQFLDLLGDRHPITFDDFEASTLVQNTIMRSFNYTINQPTPQAYLEELWIACPTLQNIQDENLELHRTNLKCQALDLLEACLLEYGAIEYPVAHLTAGALLEALHIRELHQQCNVHAGGRFRNSLGSPSKQSPARVCAACINVEICTAMQMHSSTLTSCRDWIMTTWIGGIDE